jgi:hypothetical protein
VVFIDPYLLDGLRKMKPPHFPENPQWASISRTVQKIEGKREASAGQNPVSAAPRDPSALKRSATCQAQRGHHPH